MALKDAEKFFLYQVLSQLIGSLETTQIERLKDEISKGSNLTMIDLVSFAC